MKKIEPIARSAGERCEHRIYERTIPRRCRNQATIRENGKAFCVLHAPSRVAARRQKAAAKVEKRMRAKWAFHDWMQKCADLISDFPSMTVDELHARANQLWKEKPR